MISSASISGSGRLSRSARDLSLIQNIPLQNIFHGESAPAAVRINFRPGFCARMAVFGMVAPHKVRQVGVGHGVLFQREMDVGAEVIEPDLFCLHFRTGGTLIKKSTLALTPGL